jgi:hypothetical protein
MKTLILALMLSIANISASLILAQPAVAGGESKTGGSNGGFDS